MKIKIGRIKKHHILLSLGVTATALLPLGATMACGDLTEAPNADQAKVDVAKKLFTSEITKQTLTTSIDLALQPGLRSASEINSLVGIKAMPNVAATGATVTYTALAKAGLTQTINVTITAGLVTDKSISIVLTYASHTATDQEKVTTTKNLFTPGIKTQVLTASIDHALNAGNNVNVNNINNLAGIIHMPVISIAGVTATYSVLAVNGLTQTINVSIVAGAVTDTTVNILLTFQPHVPTGDEKISAAFLMFTPTIATQTLSATIDSKLDHTASSIPVATINGLAGIIAMPDISSTGATVVYTAATPNGLTQVVTATISATGGTTKTVAVTLTFASHTPTGDEKINAAFLMFTQTITAQTLSATIDSKLDHATSTIPVATINGLAGIIAMPDTSNTGATVVYTAAAPTGLTQVVTATISATGGTTKTVAITLTFKPHVPTGDEKINAAFLMFTPTIATQTLSATIDSKLDHSASSVPVATINGLAGIIAMPDTSNTGATVVYTAAAPTGLTQVVTATISATGGTTKTVAVTLTFKPHVPTSDEKINAAFLMFTPTIATQTLSATIDNKLDHSASSIPVATINGLAGIIAMPDTSNTGATVVYTADAPTGLTQVVTATISATGGTTKTVAVTLTFKPHVPTSDEQIESAVLMFTPDIRAQTLTVGMENRLDQTSTDIPVETINGLAGLTHRMPDISSTGATVVYTAASTTNILKQKVIATISSTGGTTRTVDILLTYTMSVPYFESLYPGKLLSNGTVIDRLAFADVSLPQGFSLPATVEEIHAQAFSHDVLPAGFTLPAAVRLITVKAFEFATLPAGFALRSTMTLERQAFYATLLPAGFTIPIGITMVDASSSNFSFYDVHLPTGYEWHDAQGNKIADQTKPVPGCVVAPITP